MRSGEIGREVRREGSIVRVGEPKPVTLAPSVSKILTTAATSEIWGDVVESDGGAGEQGGGKEGENRVFVAGDGDVAGQGCGAGNQVSSHAGIL